MDYQQEKNYLLALWKTSPRAATVIVRARYPDLYNLVSMTPGKTFSEKSWKWINNSTGGICNHCQKPTRYLDFGRGYALFCSQKCTSNSLAIRDKKSLTAMNRYGVSHYSSTNEYKTKFKETCQSRYGVSNPGQIESKKEARAKSKQLTFFINLIDKIKEYSSPLFSFEDYTNVRDKELEWECKKCNQIFKSNLFGKFPKCPICFPPGNIGGQSSVEKEILDEIRKFFTGEIIENSRHIISPKEIDIYFPKEKFAIEVNGLYWHSKVDSDYHQKKFVQCQEKGIRLFMVTDKEWSDNKKLVLRMIQHRLCISNKAIPARKCQVRTITSTIAKPFLESNHLRGHSKASAYYGLYQNDELLSVMSIMKNRFTKDKSQFEIIRFAFGETSVVGALGKFLSEIRKSYPDSDITTYADLRYGEGRVYNNNGFIESHITKPGYWYFLNDRIYHRLSWTKKKLVSLGFSPHKTELEIMNEIGALRIYDCGHKHFILRSKIDE